MRCSIIILVLGGSGTGVLNVPRIQAAPSAYVTPITPALTPASTRTEGRAGSGGVNPTPTAVTIVPHDMQQTYRVQPGDNIYLIAQKVYGDSSAFSLILRANNLSENSRLTVDMVLKIPPLPTRTVTLTPSPTVTASKTSPPSDPAPVATSGQAVTPERSSVPIPGVSSAEGQEAAIMAMLTNAVTATLVASSVVCAFLAFLVFTSARRGSSQHAMARRVRPPLMR